MKHKNQEAQKLEVDYLSRLREALTGIPDMDVEEIIQEVHRHIEDAIAELPDEEVTLSKMAGILEILGPPESFAEKNSVENISTSPTMSNGKYDLPVFETLYNTTITLVYNFSTLFRALFLPSIIIFFLSMLMGLVANHNIPVSPDAVNGGSLLAVAFIFLIYLPVCAVLSTMMAVTCHRVILLGKDALPNVSGIYFSMRELKYLGWGVLFTAPWVICILIFIFSFSFIFLLLKITDTDSLTSLIRASNIISLFIVTFVTAPFILVLPATAVEEERPFNRAREAVRGNTVRLAAVLIIIPLISWILYTALRLAGGGINNIPFVILNSILGIVYVVFSIAALSVSYKALTNKR